MTTSDAPPPTRRTLRTRAEDFPAAAADDTLTDGAGDTLVDAAASDDPLAALGVPETLPTALAWVDPDRLDTRPVVRDLRAATMPYVPVDADLLARAPRRTWRRPGVLTPLALSGLVVAAYAATTLLWPLYAVAPTVEAVAVQPASAPAAAPAWPVDGSAAVSVAGIDGSLASSGDASTIASITKLVTALVVLERMPLEPGESGPEFRFTAADRTAYWDMRANGGSALDVPVGGVLTQYQLLEGVLIGSANNYAERLAGNLWPNDAVFADAARTWLDAHGVTGITVVEPTGLDMRNTATPDALLTLAARAMAHPVIAEIVAKASIDLPGAGVVENTNVLLEDPGVVGLKTGSLDAFTLLAAKDVPVGDTVVRVYASVLGQPDSETRFDATSDLFAQTERELDPTVSVPAGTIAGQVVTEWGEPVPVVTSEDAAVVLWNSAGAAAAPDFALGDAAEQGAEVGTLTVSGPLDTAAVGLELGAELEGPSILWRLTHPLELFGLV